ncbi:hypothetical protein [Desulfatibacillum aliphaticivorans]|uniref:hypothetical protein n=1 Tax=Desulfatibacillum aliphaticivorans TaxID=218208 RepID=UPI0003F88262|nr:hypothetical protein [Desulfatibacillum aliphaticivorans]
MGKMERLNRVVVAIFDIVSYSKKTLDQQKEDVEFFIQELEVNLESLSEYEPDVHSTGDGAIISLGRKCDINKNVMEKFTHFIINFAIDMCQNGLEVKASANYSEFDHVFITKDYQFVQNKVIQIGDTINIAERILNFCDDREIMISKSYYDLLRNLNIGTKFEFVPNDVLICKHGIELQTYTYSPPVDYKECVYSPSSPGHTFKKYSYFPPIKGDVLRFYMSIGLDHELDKVASRAFETVKQVNITKNMATHTHVIDILNQLNYESDDNVLVISREDQKAAFWKQIKGGKYISNLESNAKKSGGTINQTRIRVYNSANSDSGLADDNGILGKLAAIHKKNTYYSIHDFFPELQKSRELNALLFGCTISTKYKYAIIPIPDIDTEDVCVPDCGNIGTALKQYDGYDAVKWPMKTIIATEEKYIDKLIEEYQILLSSTEGHVGDGKGPVQRLK